MKVVIHIGTEKTGSTTLQEFMRLNRDVFLSNGVYVPKCLGRLNHRKLAVYCMNYNKSDEFIKKKGLIKKEKRDIFRQEVSDALAKELRELDQGAIDTVLISSEHFHSRLTDISEVERLKALFFVNGVDVKVVCYLRKQSYLMESKYSTYLKGGGYASFKVFSKDCDKSSRYYDYDHFLSIWEKCFSIDNISVREFSRAKFKENNLCIDFLEFAGLEVKKEEISFPEDQNTSFSRFGMIMMRLVNRVYKKNEKSRVRKKRRKRLVAFIFNTFSGNKPRLLSQDERNMIDKSFDRSNLEVSNRYGIQLFSDINNN